MKTSQKFTRILTNTGDLNLVCIAVAAKIMPIFALSFMALEF